MEASNDHVFKNLYAEAYLICFGRLLEQPITETESKLFSNQILERTGLSIGWRSLKNYSFYIFDHNSDRQENPSTATLDTLARYVLKAPYTNELARKKDEGHHPYWFLYQSRSTDVPKSRIGARKKHFGIFFLTIVVMLTLAYLFYLNNRAKAFEDAFQALDQRALQKRGWHLQNEDALYWMKRNLHPGSLTLFTLPGDNWPDSAAMPGIRNLLFRSVPQGCYRLELQMQDFVPAAEWQQAGILLLADSSVNSASIRLSLAYNDFFGGKEQPREIIVQAISSPGNGAKPEEFIHYRTLAPDSAAKNPVLFGNLKHTALRIEKQGNHYRFLYSGGFTSNGSFKELAIKDIPILPRYVAIFALKGRVDHSPVVPVTIRKFIFQPTDCSD